MTILDFEEGPVRLDVVRFQGISLDTMTDFVNAIKAYKWETDGAPLVVPDAVHKRYIDLLTEESRYLPQAAYQGAVLFRGQRVEVEDL